MGTFNDRTSSPEEKSEMDALREGVTKAKDRLAGGRMDAEPEPEKPAKKPRRKAK